MLLLFLAVLFLASLSLGNEVLDNPFAIGISVRLPFVFP
jgi:hypothetical protein